MSDIIPFGKAIPPHLFDGEPCILIYDPGQRIQNPNTQLHPFGQIVHVHNQEISWAHELNQSQNKQLILLLIFPTATEADIRRFIMRYVFYQPRLHSLFLIFHNGLQFHEQWSGILLRALRWCRSLTDHLISDILEACQIACNQHISFYEQGRIQADNNILHDNFNAACGIAELFAQRKRECSLMLFNYLTKLQNSDD